MHTLTDFIYIDELIDRCENFSDNHDKWKIWCKHFIQDCTNNVKSGLKPKEYLIAEAVNKVSSRYIFREAAIIDKLLGLASKFPLKPEFSYFRNKDKLPIRNQCDGCVADTIDACKTIRWNVQYELNMANFGVPIYPSRPSIYLDFVDIDIKFPDADSLERLVDFDKILKQNKSLLFSKPSLD